MLSILPLAVGMLPVNAAVYVFDGILVGASDFRFMAGARAGGGYLGIFFILFGIFWAGTPLPAPALQCSVLQCFSVCVCAEGA